MKTSLKSIPLTHPQAARYLGISATVLARLADTGKIPYTCGSQGQRRYRTYLVDDLKAYRDATSTQPLSAPPEGYVDTQTAATLMGLSPSGVLKAYAAGRLSGSIKPGKARFFAKAEIDRFVKTPSDQGLLDLAPPPVSVDSEMLTLMREQNRLLALLVEKWS